MKPSGLHCISEVRLKAKKSHTTAIDINCTGVHWKVLWGPQFKKGWQSFYYRTRFSVCGWIEWAEVIAIKVSFLFSQNKINLWISFSIKNVFRSGNFISNLHPMKQFPLIVLLQFEIWFMINLLTCYFIRFFSTAIADFKSHE